MLSFEKAFWHEHPNVVLAGVDEAGRGCLAGPVVAAAVVFQPAAAFALHKDQLSGLTDSKQLSARQREVFFDTLSTLAEQQAPVVIFGVGTASVEEIDRLNILNATHLAMRRALLALPQEAGFALIDGLPVRGLPCDSRAIVKGDSKSLSIAAASIMAKVSRDHLMLELDKEYPNYGFADHKGYGTAQHIQALCTFGVTPQHRRTFRPVADVLFTQPQLPLE